MTLVMRWRVPVRQVGLRWRGPAGLAAAVEREPLSPVAAVVGPPGTASQVLFVPLAILADSTSPVPSGGTGSAAWSSLLAAPLIWDGTAWRSLSYFVVPAVESPEWVPAGALVVSDFKNGLYWRHDIGVCAIEDIWGSSDVYNGSWTPAGTVIDGFGVLGSHGIPVNSDVFAMLDPLGDGFTAVLNGNIVSGDDAAGDSYLMMILTEPAQSNEWAVSGIVRSPLNPTPSRVSCGDYSGPIWHTDVKTASYLGHHRVALSLGYDGAAASLDGLNTSARSRAQFTYEPKPDATPGDPEWRMLVLMPADHGNTLSYTEKVVFYQRVEDSELDALSALDPVDGYDFMGDLPLGTMLERASAGARFNGAGTLVSEAADVARFDHNPVTLAPRGLLLEPQATNLLTRSEDFGTGPWTNANVAVTANSATSPDGTVNASKIVEAAGSGEHRIYQGVSGTINGQNHTRSFYAKAGERGWVSIRNDGGGRVANFDLVNGVVGTMTGFTAAIEPVGNGWYRCTATGASGTADYMTINIGDADTGTGSGYSYTGDGSSGLYLWGAQYALGAQATSYIPTTGATASRAADELTITVPAEAATAHCALLGGTDDISVSEGPLVLTAADFGGGPVWLQGIAFS